MSLLELCQEHLNYNPTSGDLVWIKKRSSKTILYRPIECFDIGGYRRVCLSGKTYKAHILCWLLYYKSLPLQMVDHINRNPADNRIENLREVTRSENGRNTNRIAQGYLTGAYPHGHKWISRFTFNKQQYYVGLFTSQQLAHEAYLCKLADLLR